MARSLADRVAEMRHNPRDARFNDVLRVAEHYFGAPRRHGSHHVFRTPWPGDPRVNLQEGESGKAKPYQVRQLLQAIEQVELLATDIRKK